MELGEMFPPGDFAGWKSKGPHELTTHNFRLCNLFILILNQKSKLNYGLKKRNNSRID